MRVEWNLAWVWWAAMAPPAVALLAGWPFWKRGIQDHMGAIAGAAVVLVAAVGFIAREYGEIEKVTARCRELEIGCHFHPDPFYRYAAFGSIAMIHVSLLFVVELLVQERDRERDNYSPEWRR
jgi:hypothetical protein